MEIEYYLYAYRLGVRDGEGLWGGGRRRWRVGERVSLLTGDKIGTGVRGRYDECYLVFD